MKKNDLSMHKNTIMTQQNKDYSKSLVRFICIILSPLILLSGCSMIFEIDDHPLKYNGEQYRVVRNWEMINKDDYTENKATWAGKEYGVIVYSDLQECFIFNVYYQLLYHNEADTLPDYKDINRVEKMEIIFSDVNRCKTILDSEEIFGTVIGLMSQPYDHESFKITVHLRKQSG